ncbi:hypothetical protein LTR95_006479 [Oleoguttula sp. CCFEE 5521]
MQASGSTHIMCWSCTGSLPRVPSTPSASPRCYGDGSMDDEADAADRSWDTVNGCISRLVSAAQTSGNQDIIEFTTELPALIRNAIDDSRQESEAAAAQSYRYQCDTWDAQETIERLREEALEDEHVVMDLRRAIHEHEINEDGALEDLETRGRDINTGARGLSKYMREGTRWYHFTSLHFSARTAHLVLEDRLSDFVTHGDTLQRDHTPPCRSVTDGHPVHIILDILPCPTNNIPPLPLSQSSAIMDYHILDSCLVRLIATAHSTSDTNIIDVAAEFASALKDERDGEANGRRRRDERIRYLETVLPARDDEIDKMRNALRAVADTENSTIAELQEKLKRAEEVAKLIGETPARVAASLAGASEEIKELLKSHFESDQKLEKQIWEYEKLRSEHQGCQIYLNQRTMENVTLLEERHNQVQIHSENEELKKEVADLKARLKHEDKEVIGLYDKLDELEKALEMSRKSETAAIGLLLDRQSPDAVPEEREERQAFVDDVTRDFRKAFAEIDGSSTESEDEEMTEGDTDKMEDGALGATNDGAAGPFIATVS